MQSEHLQVALGLAHEAGAIMKKNFMLGMKKQWKDDHTALTETDLAIHTLVETKLKQVFPEHGILSEEGDGTHLPDAEYLWVCDPLDGTHNFAAGIPTATFMLSLVKSGVPILAVIYDPFMDRMFFAEKGMGAFMNDLKISVCDATSLQRTVLGIGKWSGAANIFPVAKELRDRGVRLVTGLSIGYMGALVAAGEFSAVIFAGKDPHDTAALKLLVEEAGGVVTDLKGENTRYDTQVEGCLGANPTLHREILSVIAEYGN